MLGQFLPAKLILRKLLRVDGEGSGLDADLWDGFERDVKPSFVSVTIEDVFVPTRESVVSPPSSVVAAEINLPTDFFLLTSVVFSGSCKTTDGEVKTPYYDYDIDFEAGKVRFYVYNYDTWHGVTYNGEFRLYYLASEHAPLEKWESESVEITYTMRVAMTLGSQEVRDVCLGHVLVPGENVEVQITSAEFYYFNPPGYENDVELTGYYSQDANTIHIQLRNNHTDTISFDHVDLTLQVGWLRPPDPWKYIFIDNTPDQDVTLQPGESITIARSPQLAAVTKGQVVRTYVAYTHVSDPSQEDQISFETVYDSENNLLKTTITNNGTVEQTIYHLLIVAQVNAKMAGGSYSSAWKTSEWPYQRISAGERNGAIIHTGTYFGVIDYLEFLLSPDNDNVKIGYRHPVPSDLVELYQINPTDQTYNYTNPQIRFRYLY